MGTKVTESNAFYATHLKVFVNKFSCKGSIRGLFGYFEKHPFKVITTVSTFWQLLQTLGYFLFSNPVTLL